MKMIDPRYTFSLLRAPRSLVGHEGYFGNSLEELHTNAENNRLEKVKVVFNSELSEVNKVFCTETDNFYGLFIPKEFVHES